MTGPNVDLLDATLAHIETNPQDWDQRYWRCSSGMCFAGTAALLAGGTFPYRADDDQAAPGNPIATRSELVANADGELAPIEVFAAKALRLTEREENALFAASNHLADIREVVADIKAGALR